MNIIYETIQNLKAVSSRNLKANILKLVSEDIELKRFLYIVYNPFYNYKLNIRLSDVTPDNELQLTIIDFMDFVEEHLEDKNISLKSYDILKYLNSQDLELSLLISNRSILSGVGIKTINKVFNNLIPFIPFDKRNKYYDYPMYSYKKIGKFVNIILNKKGILILNKLGAEIVIKNLLLLDELYELYIHFNKDIVIHGELLLKHNTIYMTDVLCYTDWVKGETTQILKSRIQLLIDTSYLSLNHVKLINLKLIHSGLNNPLYITRPLSSKWKSTK